MTRNILILCGPASAADKAGSLAAQAGSTLGLVNTCLDPSAVKTRGGRIEEQRAYGGHTFHAFDEPLSVGSAIAQLAGYADAIVVDRLDDWAGRLTKKFGADEERIASEVTSVTSVLSAHLADVVLLSAPATLAAGAAAELHRHMLAEFQKHLTQVIDLTKQS
jgi:hypothetical protein